MYEAFTSSTKAYRAGEKEANATFEPIAQNLWTKVIPIITSVMSIISDI